MKSTVLMVAAAASTLAAPLLLAVQSIEASQLAVWAALACMVVDRITQSVFQIRAMREAIAVLKARVDAMERHESD